MSLLHRIIVLILLAVLPVAGVEVYTQFVLMQQREQDVEARAMRLVRHIEVEYARLSGGLRHTLMTLAATDIARNEDTPRCQILLEELKPGFPDYLSFHVTDERGTILCSTDHNAIGQSAAAQPYFMEAVLRGAFTEGEFSTLIPDGPLQLPFSVPVLNSDGIATGVVMAAVTTAWLQDFLTKQPLPEAAEAMLANDDGTVLAARSEEAIIVGYPLPTPYLEFLDTTENGIARVIGPRGRDQVLAYLPLKVAPKGLFAAVALDTDTALTPLREAGLRALLLAGVVVLLTVLGAIWGANVFLRRPISDLINATRRWRAGDFTTRSRMGGATELGELGRAFDEMAAHLAEKERTREAAAKAEQRMATVLASTTDGVVNIDRDWRFTYINPNAADVLPGGERLLGQNVFEALPELHGSEFERECRTALATRKPVEFEAFFPPLQAWFAVRAFPSKDGLSLYFQDVTSRRRDEQALALAARQRSELMAQLNALLENAPVGLIYMDRQGRYVRVNAAMARMNGLSEHDHIGRHISDVVPGIDAVAIQGNLYRVFTEHRAISDLEMSGEVATEPGVLRHWLTSWFPVMVEDEVLFAGVVTQDITASRRIEAALRIAKDEAEAANRAKSSFLAAASHDLRQPLQSLFLFRAALDRHVTDAEGRHKFDMLGVGLNTLKGLLDGLLDVSRLESGSVEPCISAFPITPLLEDICDSYRPVAEDKGLRFDATTDCDLAVKSDPILLGRMIRNLVENGIRYTPRGFVRLECHPTDDGHVRIGVVDSGIGIPADQTKLIFDEFHQVGNPERDRTRGLGLGLPIVRRLSELLGHPVAVSTEPDKGSSFSILVPQASHPLRAEVIRPATKPGRGRFAVLIEDDALVLIGLQATLEDFGFDVLAAGSSDEALRRLNAEGRRPDVVLTDYRLRGEEVGTHAVRRIRALFKYPVPGLVLTGETGQDTRDDAASNGLGILHKPIDPDRLSDALERLMAPA